MTDPTIDGMLRDIDDLLADRRDLLVLLQSILSTVKELPGGDYAIVRSGGVHCLPDALNDALKQARVYLDDAGAHGRSDE